MKGQANYMRRISFSQKNWNHLRGLSMATVLRKTTFIKVDIQRDSQWYKSQIQNKTRRKVAKYCQKTIKDIIYRFERAAF